MWRRCQFCSCVSGRRAVLAHLGIVPELVLLSCYQAFAMALLQGRKPSSPRKSALHAACL